MKVCACGKCHDGTIFKNKKGCGKQLGDEDFPFYCGKECDLCHDCHIHYCKDCGINYESTDNHGITHNQLNNTGGKNG